MINEDNEVVSSSQRPRPANELRRINDLPTEIRFMIWQLCLPRRIIEVNKLLQYSVLCLPEEDEVDMYGYAVEYLQPGCELTSTSRANMAAPAIARVCREARHIVFQEYGVDGRQITKPDSEMSWLRQMGAIPHIYCSRESGEDHTLALAVLNTAMKPSHFCGSFDYNWFTRRDTEGDCAQFECVNPRNLPGDSADCVQRTEPPSASEYPQTCADIEILKTHSYWLCMVEIVVIHISHERALVCGLFGLLGDEPIQIVETSDHRTLDALYSLENTSLSDTMQINHREAADYKVWLKRSLWCYRFPDYLLEQLRPAVMFRLCTKDCTPHNATGRPLPPNY